MGRDGSLIQCNPPHPAIDTVSGFPSQQGTQRTHVQVRSRGLGPSLVSKVSLCHLVHRHYNYPGMDFWDVGDSTLKL